MLLFIVNVTFRFREKANLAISLVDERNEILGHAAFFDYPPGRHADQCNWEKWLKSHHDISQSTVR